MGKIIGIDPSTTRSVVAITVGREPGASVLDAELEETQGSP